MFLSSLVLLLVCSAMGQFIIPSAVPFTGLPYALTIPFKGNPLVHDIAPLGFTYLNNPWKDIVIDTLPEKNEAKGKPEVDILLPSYNVRMSPTTKDKHTKFSMDICSKPEYCSTVEDLCRIAGLGCSWVQKHPPMMTNDDLLITMQK